MSALNKTPSQGRGRVASMSQYELAIKILDDHKKSLGEVIEVKIDDRTSIELPANLSREEIEERKKNFLKNMKNKRK